MVVMHGLFDLKPGCVYSEFKSAFDDFCSHLKQEKLLNSWRYMQHTPHDIYDARPPVTEFYVAMEFLDSDQAEESKDYVVANREPVKSLHSQVNSKVTNTQFFLYKDVE